MTIADEKIEEVRAAANILSYTLKFTSLRKEWGYWVGRCPLHPGCCGELFCVKEDPPIFHCFGCLEGGDIFKLAMLAEKVSYPEAVRIVGRYSGVEV